MDEKHERQVRRSAIRRRLRHEQPSAIAATLQRSRQWLNKWWQRFLHQGWAGLKSQSRRPAHLRSVYDAEVRHWIAQARRILQRARVGLIGPEAVQLKLRQWRMRPLPSRATIGRVLREQGLTRAAVSRPSPAPYYPHPHPTAHYQLHALDWTSHQLRRGTTVFTFNTLDYASRDLHSRVYRDKSAATVCADALNVWHTLGLPDGLQMDNDGAFSGGRRGPRVLSRFVRLCLYVGIEPIFIPFYEAERNEAIEAINGLWQRSFWLRRRFRSVPEVQRRNPEFEHWYCTDYLPPALQGETPAQAARHQMRCYLTAEQVQSIPERLPITAGRIDFLRLVDTAGDIVVLNESWQVGRRWAGEYVWVVIWTAQHRLQVYHRRSAETPVRMLKQWPYHFRQPVVPLRPEFRRHPRRRKMSTML